MIETRHIEAGVVIYYGDCREVMLQLPSCSVDSVVTDPPYELGFMGKGWDRSGIAYDVTVWRECLRLLKPGGHLLAFGGSRTYHRLACAIEDAGFEIRDQIQWIYGSGFPKSLDVSKAIDAAAGVERSAVGIADSRGRDGATRQIVESTSDGYGFTQKGGLILTAPSTDAAKQWDGWGTALKPAHEPIVLARKPLIGTVAANVLEYGTGGLNVDGCRIEGVDGNGHWSADDSSDQTSTPGYDGGFTRGGSKAALGRWPANVIHDGSAEVLVEFAKYGDRPVGASCIKGESGKDKNGNTGAAYGQESRPAGTAMIAYGDSGSAARFFYCAKASKEDREEGLENLPARDCRETVNRDPESAGVQSPRAGAGRGAAAPIYRCSQCGLNLQGGRAATKCPVSDEHVRELVGYGELSRNHHPTVKPTDLMRYLVRLVTPPGGTVLDPFCGSGSTGKACALEQMNAILIDSEADYCDLAAARSRLAQGLLAFG